MFMHRKRLINKERERQMQNWQWKRQFHFRLFTELFSLHLGKIFINTTKTGKISLEKWKVYWSFN